MPQFTDRSLPPASETVRFQRQDGSVVTISVDRGQLEAPPPAAMERAGRQNNQEQRVDRLLDILDGPAVSPAQPPAPATPDAPTPNGHKPLRPLPLEVVGTPEGRPHGPRKAATTPDGQPSGVEIGDPKIFEHPTIGGKFTLFVLMYGDFPDMHRECVEHILATVPPGRIDLRIGSNQLCDESVAMVENLVHQGLVSKHYRHRDNRKKYPVMREMFYDSGHPITTKYLIWFDDDTICNKDKYWLYKLADCIVRHHNQGYRMYGPEYFYRLNKSQMDWVRSGSWYQGRPFTDSKGNEIPNGNKVRFATGSFWALEVDAMRRCEIPDPRIGHNGGDYMIGAQLQQGGYRLKPFSNNKSVVTWSAYKRRGLNEKHAGK